MGFNRCATQCYHRPVPVHHEEPKVDLAEMVGEFERKLERLKVLYEQYFIGIEKREPTVPLKEVVRLLHAIDQYQIRNTGLRFRFRTLVQKFNMYRTYWHRTLRAIENGTYGRDVARMSRSLAKKGIAMPQLGRVASPGEVERAVASALRESDTGRMPAIRDEEDDPTPPVRAPRPPPPAPEPVLGPIALPEEDEDETTNPGTRPPATASGPPLAPAGPPSLAPAGPPPRAPAGPPPLPVEQPRPAFASPPPLPVEQPRPAFASPGEPPVTGSRPPPIPPAERPRPPQPGPSGAGSRALPEAEMRSLFRRFVKAKQMCGEDVSNIRYESLVKSISHQLPKIQAEHGREVEFQVVIREGRAVLRAKPR